MDPNLCYMRQQVGSSDLDATLQDMCFSDMQALKSQMMAEYQKIPITVSGKSLHIKKRKEELEFELDIVEKHMRRFL